jgi:hypothetical protein
MKRWTIWMLLVLAMVGATSCTSMRHQGCMATKVGNHR